MSDVPPEIITVILVRLPVKSLLRARCVSKPWRSLIDSKGFIKQHLRHSVETNSNRTLLGECNSSSPLSYDPTKFFYIDLDSLKRLDTGDLRSKPQYVVGSCNGLVLFLTYSNDIVLWNPATRKLKELPATPLPPEMEQWTSGNKGCFRDGLYSLGYDSEHDDYKVVRVMQLSRFPRRLSCTETKIYSLKTNSWKIVGGIYMYKLISSKPRGVYLNDAVHAVVRKLDDGYNLGIVAINLAKEEHYEFPTPCPFVSSLEVIGGCLAAFSGDVWVMKEYGVQESWCKLFSFDHFVRYDLGPLGYSKSGDEVLVNVDGKRLAWYNLEKRSSRIACVEGLSDAWARVDRLEDVYSTTDAWVCFESLVSPDSPPTAAGVEIKKQDAEKGRVSIS